MLNIQPLIKPDFSCKDALECFFNLNPLESTAYSILVTEGPLTAKELGDRMEKDRSTSYRALKTLISTGLCYKETRNIEKGGYYHVYKAIPPVEVKSRVKQLIEIWYEKMTEAVDHFDEYERELRANN